MRVVDYIAERLYKMGVKHVFFVPGFGCAYMTDALARHKELRGVSCHHEQAAAMAALSYAKYKSSLGACFVTTGCGGTNAITGLLHAYNDNVPCLFVSGQLEQKQTLAHFGLPLRQIGKQEADIIPLVRNLTKYAVTVTDPYDIAYHFDKAADLAQSGRPGPVWLDIPLDIQQGPIINENRLKQYVREEVAEQPPVTDSVDIIMGYIENAERPVVLAGHGVRLSHSVDEFREFVHKFRLPVVTSCLGTDLLDAKDELSIGTAGTLCGSRPGNFAIANSDLVLVLGCRLSINLTGFRYEHFARAARVVVVDIDELEHSKKTVEIDHFIKSDLKPVLRGLSASAAGGYKEDWITKCGHWKKIFPFYSEDDAEAELINIYYFNEMMSGALKPDSIVISDAGSVFFSVAASIKISGGMRSITSGGQAEMGFSLPGAIGACYASGFKETACVTGDGSIMMNLQELQTISRGRLPIKIFVINNNGYCSIRNMQNSWFRRTIGTEETDGLSLPSFEKIAYAFDLPYAKIEKSSVLLDRLNEVLNMEGPVLCEVMCQTDQMLVAAGHAKNSKNRIAPRPLEDMAPFIDRDLFYKEMIIAPVDD